MKGVVFHAKAEGAKTYSFFVMPDLIRHPCDGARRRENSPQTENPPELRRFDPAASTFLPVGVSVHFAPCCATRPSAASSSRIGVGGELGAAVGEALQARALGVAEGEELEFFLVGHGVGLWLFSARFALAFLPTPLH